MRTIELTTHAQQRANHRAISSEMIQDTLDFGHCILKQGIQYFVMLEKCIPDQFTPSYRGRIKNTVVLLSEVGSVITVYKSRNALHNIKTKRKRNGKKVCLMPMKNAA